MSTFRVSQTSYIAHGTRFKTCQCAIRARDGMHYRHDHDCDLIWTVSRVRTALIESRARDRDEIVEVQRSC